MGAAVEDGDGGKAGVQHQPVSRGSAQMSHGVRVGGVAAEGKLVPELPEPGFLVLGDYAVGDGVVTPSFQPASRTWLTVSPFP